MKTTVTVQHSMASSEKHPEQDSFLVVSCSSHLSSMGILLLSTRERQCFQMRVHCEQASGRLKLLRGYTVCSLLKEPGHVSCFRWMIENFPFEDMLLCRIVVMQRTARNLSPL